MKRKSLQEIQDHYENLGYKGDKLRKVLKKDKEWLAIVKERDKKLTNKFSLTKLETEKYVLSTDEDYEILAKIKKLEKLELTKEDEIFLRFLKTQLEHDWRKPLIKELNRILKEYGEDGGR